MTTRRAFVKRAGMAALAVPLAGCMPQQPAAPPDSLAEALARTKAALKPEQVEAARQAAKQFQALLDTVRNADIPYSVEPRFYPEA